MTQISDTPRTATVDRFLRLASGRESVVRDYALAISGKVKAQAAVKRPKAFLEELEKYN